MDGANRNITDVPMAQRVAEVKHTTYIFGDQYFEQKVSNMMANNFFASCTDCVFVSFIILF